MGQRRVTSRELADLLDELRRRGARDVRRDPPRFDGSIDVRWTDSPAEIERYQADLRAYRPGYALAGVAVALGVVVLILLAF